jgi:hypothetical protein
MKNVLLFSSLLLLAIACRKTPDVNCDKPTNEMTASRKLIKGTWIWKSERVYIRALQKILIKTPETEGYTQTLICNDSTMTFYKNDSIVGTEPYAIDQQSKATKYDLDVNPVLLFKDRKTNTYHAFTPFNLCSDSLFLKWSVVSDLAGNEIWYRK